MIVRDSDANTKGNPGNPKMPVKIHALLLVAVAQSWPVSLLAQDAPSLKVKDVTPSTAHYQFVNWWGFWMEHGVDATIKLRNTFEHDWKRAVGAEQTYQMQGPSYADRMDLSQAQFLCSWRGHTPGNPRPLDICSPGNALARQVVEDREAAAQIVKEAAVHDKQHRERAKQAAAA